MARTNKIGLDYFNLEVNFFADIKIRKLIKYQSGKAVTVYAYLLCTIYQKGYYVKWDNELPFIISEITGFEEAYILEVIKCCVNIGLFDKGIYEQDAVLTSKGIQERFNEISQKSKRNARVTVYNTISSERTLISSEEIPITPETIPNNSEDIPQSKEKKREVKKTKETLSNESAKKAKLVAAKAATLQRRDLFYDSLKPYVDKYGKEMIREFYDYWSELTKSQIKMRFELNKTWELSKRLATWHNKPYNHSRIKNGISKDEFIQQFLNNDYEQ